MTTRKEHKQESNNWINTNKNVCALAVAQALDVGSATRYLHTWEDLMVAARTRWSVRSIRSYVKGATVGAIRRQLVGLERAVAFVIMVEEHVVLLGVDGKTIVDTDPRKFDRRKVEKVYAVYCK